MLNNPTTILAPLSGTVEAIDVSTSASTAEDTGVTDGTKWYHFRFDPDTAAAGDTLYIIFGATSSVPDPDQTEVGAGELDIPFSIPAGELFAVQVNAARRYFKVKGSVAGTLRYYPTGS